MTDAVAGGGPASWPDSGKVYDLGITYSRRSYKWPGHSPGEIISFRSPGGEAAQKECDRRSGDQPQQHAVAQHALFMNDNVATQIDGLGHITAGDDNHWYNGFKEADWGGDFGVLKCDATTIPPIVARGVLLDVAAARKVDELPSHYAITPADIDAALAQQKVEAPAGRRGADPHRHAAALGDRRRRPREDRRARLGRHHLETAKWLVEQHGAILIGSDTSGLEVDPAATGSDSFIPVHSTCSSSRASTSASSTTWKTSPRTRSMSSATSQPSTRSRRRPPASLCGRWRMHELIASSRDQTWSRL